MLRSTSTPGRTSPVELAHGPTSLTSPTHPADEPANPSSCGAFIRGRRGNLRGYPALLLDVGDRRPGVLVGIAGDVPALARELGLKVGMFAAVPGWARRQGGGCADAGPGGPGGLVPRGSVHLWWAGTGRGGPTQAIPCPNPPRPVPTHGTNPRHRPTGPRPHGTNPRHRPTAPGPTAPTHGTGPPAPGPTAPTHGTGPPAPGPTAPTHGTPAPVRARRCGSARTWCRGRPIWWVDVRDGGLAPRNPVRQPTT